MSKKLQNITGYTDITVDGKKAHFHGVPNDLKARWVDGDKYTHLKFISVSYSAGQGKVTMNYEAVYGDATGDLGRDALIAANVKFNSAIAAKILEKFVK